LSRLTAEFTTFNTGGSLITTPSQAATNNTTYPNKLGFDHMQSYFIGVEGNPSNTAKVNVEFNVLGNVAQNPIDQIFYENRGRPVTVNSDNGNVTLDSNNRVQVYRASYTWNQKLFNLNGFIEQVITIGVMKAISSDCILKLIMDLKLIYTMVLLLLVLS